MFWLILLVIVVVGFVAWRMRVPLLAKILGQSESRINRQNQPSQVRTQPTRSRDRQSTSSLAFISSNFSWRPAGAFVDVPRQGGALVAEQEVRPQPADGHERIRIHITLAESETASQMPPITVTDAAKNNSRRPV
jgi:hypothetical protein